MTNLRLGSIAPDFEAETTAGPIKFHDWIGDSWVRRYRLLIPLQIMDLLLLLRLRLFYSLILATSLQSAPPSWEKLPDELLISKLAT
jgi:hypothetical protein